MATSAFAPTVGSVAREGLRFDRLSKSFPGTKALDGVSFTADRGEVHALVGGNGSGKSTLVKILAGVLPGDPGGRIAVGPASIPSHRVSPEWARRAHLSFVHQDLGLAGGLSVAENMFAGLAYPGRACLIDWRSAFVDAQDALDRLGIAVDARALVGDLRPVGRTLVAVARAVTGRQRLSDGALILDEPTARLPAAEVELVLSALRRCAASGQTVLYVSHRLEEVLSVADRVTVLRDGRLVATEPARGLTPRRLAHLIVGRKLVSARPQARRDGAEASALDVRGLSGGPLRDVTFSITRGEVLGLAGIVGSGRTSLLEMLFGVLPRGSGDVEVAGRPLPGGDERAAVSAGMAYVPEDRIGDAAFPSLGLHENISASDLRCHRRGLRFSHASERADARRTVTRFAVRTPAVTAPLLTLSGGNQQKAMLARWLLRHPRVLLLDEPTQGVDVGARSEIYEYIVGAACRGVSVLVASSDLDELLQLSDRVIVLTGGMIADEGRRAEIDRHWVADRLHGLAQAGEYA
jgi:ribose transport system ATP-binding protein